LWCDRINIKKLNKFRDPYINISDRRITNVERKFESLQYDSSGKLTKIKAYLNK
jgi:hypothetical protein